MTPLPTLLFFLYNFLPNFLYDFIGISLEIVYGMGYWCFGYVFYRWYGLVEIDTTAVTFT